MQAPDYSALSTQCFDPSRFSRKRRLSSSSAPQPVHKRRRSKEEHAKYLSESRTDLVLQDSTPKEESQLLSPSPSAKRRDSPQHSPHPSYPKAASLPCPSHRLETERKLERKRRRLSEPEAAEEGPSEKRPRADYNSNRKSHPIENWLQKGSWPRTYFKSGSQTWEDLKADTISRGFEADWMNDLASPLLARRKSAASLRRQALEASTISPTEKSEDKSLPYRSLGYETLLKRKGSYLVESIEGINDDCKLVCQTLLTTTQVVPHDSLFRDDIFIETCNKLRSRNEARVVEDISRLIVPSAETLATYGANELKNLIANVNERWTESIPITDTRPQPDYCAGFGLTAFTDDQLQKLAPYIGDVPPVNYFSFFLATWRMYFPFLACEAKSGIGELDVADKQNAYSMTMAVRGIVELFKLVNREEELHRKIIAFSISHDDKTVRIYGHYAILKDRVATFYRHSIRTFDFTEQNGKEKWTAYQFTKNVYFDFMPKLHELICSAIDQISSKSASQNPNLTPHDALGDSFGTGLESEQPDSQEIAPSAPGSQDTTSSRKRRLTGSAILNETLKEEREMFKQERHEARQWREEAKQREEMLLEQFEQQREEAKQREEILLVQLEKQRDEAKRERDQLLELLRSQKLRSQKHSSS